MKFGNILVGKRLFVGCGKPEALGKGESEIRGSAYVEGPLQVGRDTEYSEVEATVMIAEEFNPDTASQPDLSVKVKGNVDIQGDDKTPQALYVTGDVTIIGDTGQTGDITASGTITAATFIGAHTGGSISGGVSGKSAGAKAFDILHPTKDGHRLRHICLEGPESAVYFRGKVRNRTTIQLPKYWKGLVDYTTITVSLTPIGAHQNVIVKRVDEDKIYLQAQGGMPINCYFHVYGTRQDIERLVVEYEGASTDDYPGDNSIYSINK